MQSRKLSELAEHVSGRVCGDCDILIKSAATLSQASSGDISFLANSKYESQLQSTGASAVVVGKEVEAPADLLIADDPYYAFCQIVILLHGHRQHEQVGISGKASIDKTASVGTDCQIHDFVTISRDVTIGEHCVLYPGVFVGPETEIGNNCILYPNVVVYDRCKIGNRVIIQSNATIGEDGFGFATHNGEHNKIPHIGTVVIEDDVEIGSGCGIERGALDKTVIGKGSKIGDMVAIGHGTKVGPHCLLVVQVGISGSTNLGHHCVVGGQVGIVGHINIGNCVKIAAQSGVSRSIPDGKTVLGAPATDANVAKRIYAARQYLPEMHKSLRDIERRLAKMEKSRKS